MVKRRKGEKKSSYLLVMLTVSTASAMTIKLSGITLSVRYKGIQQTTY